MFPLVSSSKPAATRAYKAPVQFGCGVSQKALTPDTFQLRFGQEQPSLPDGLTIGRAQKKDILAMIRFMEQIKREEFGGPSPSSTSDLYRSLPAREKAMEELFAQGGYWHVVKDPEGKVLGCASSRIQKTKKGKRALIGNVYVDPSIRGNGIARRMVLDLLQRSRQIRDVKGAVLMTDNPAAIKLYESLSFKTLGKDTRDYTVMGLLF